MKPLDPVEVRLFPTLAAYARKVRRREVVALVGLALSAYIIGRDVLSAYQLRVAKENMHAVVGRVNDLETTCQEQHPKKFITTKAQSAVLVERMRREKERE